MTEKPAPESSPAPLQAVISSLASASHQPFTVQARKGPAISCPTRKIWGGEGGNRLMKGSEMELFLTAQRQWDQWVYIQPSNANQRRRHRSGACCLAPSFHRKDPQQHKREVWRRLFLPGGCLPRDYGPGSVSWKSAQSGITVVKCDWKRAKRADLTREARFL